MLFCMFQVYGIQGRLYSGALEQVRELAAVQAVARARALAPVGTEALPPSVLVTARGLPPPQEEPAPRSTEAQAALAAYAGTPERQPLTQVQQLMSRRLISVRYSASLRQAWHVLARASVGQAPVLGPQGEVMGLVTRADLLRDLPEDLAEAGAFSRRLDGPVREAMWTPVPVAQTDTPVREAAQLMLDLGLPGLPVADASGLLLGFLSRSDLLRALTHEPPLDLWS